MATTIKLIEMTSNSTWWIFLWRKTLNLFFWSKWLEKFILFTGLWLSNQVRVGIRSLRQWKGREGGANVALSTKWVVCGNASHQTAINIEILCIYKYMQSNIFKVFECVINFKKHWKTFSPGWPMNTISVSLVHVLVTQICVKQRRYKVSKP